MPTGLLMFLQQQAVDIAQNHQEVCLPKSKSKAHNAQSTAGRRFKIVAEKAKTCKTL